jgi:hypothetical protein
MYESQPLKPTVMDPVRERSSQKDASRALSESLAFGWAPIMNIVSLSDVFTVFMIAAKAGKITISPFLVVS